jgi:alkylation response protein AidB-like acyl-CoA dehydrogenase
MTHLIPERLGIAISAAAATEAVIELTLDYVKERKAFGKPIGSFQNSRFVLADAKIRAEVTRSFMDRTLQRYVDGTCTVAEAAMAKTWATEALSDVCDTCVQMHGGYGYTTEYKVSEYWVDSRVNRIYGGTNEIMRELVGRSLGL